MDKNIFVIGCGTRQASMMKLSELLDNIDIIKPIPKEEPKKLDLFSDVKCIYPEPKTGRQKRRERRKNKRK